MCFNSLTEGGSSYPKESFEPLAWLPFPGNTCLFFQLETSLLFNPIYVL